MKSKAWEKTIREQMVEIGTYRPAFDRAIETLSTILEQRDKAHAEFLADGRTVIEKISDRGAVNVGKNPLLVIWMDLNTQALTYWRGLGLTPAGLKRIDEQSMKPKKRSVLAEALKELGG